MAGMRCATSSEDRAQRFVSGDDDIRLVDTHDSQRIPIDGRDGTRSGLAVPLQEEQIAVAQDLHWRLTQWSAADAALDALRTAFPVFTLESCLLKVAAVNQLSIWAVKVSERSHRQDI